jgi:subtilisin-like proprotein convertase family protein
LPPGITGNFTPTQIPTLPGSSSLQLGANNTAPAGANVVVVRGTSGAITRDRNVTFNVTTGLPGIPTLTAPADGATSVSTTPTFTWSAVAQASSYLVEAADNAGFSPTLFSQSVTGTSLVSPVSLPASTQIFWRVTPSNACGAGPTSAVFSFTTSAEICRTISLAIPDNNPTGVSDSIVIPTGAALTDLNVAFQATHTWTGDLIVRLTKVGSPTTLTLIDRPGVPTTTFGCNGDNPNLVLDDEEPTRTAEANCVPDPGPAYTPGATYRPNQALTGFDGTTLAGTWTLTVSDAAAQDTGTFTRWCLFPSP